MQNLPPLSQPHRRKRMTRQQAQPGTDPNDRIVRPSWQEYFMEITELVAKRSTCRRRAVGAIIVKDKRILSTGYNGAPAGVRHCIDIGCLREQLGVASGERHELCRGIHAEQNAIIQAAMHGVSIRGGDAFLHQSAVCHLCKNDHKRRNSNHFLQRGVRRPHEPGASG